MFDEFLYNAYRSIRLDKNLYKDKKIFQNLSLYFTGLIIIIAGFAGLYAQNTFVEYVENSYGNNNLSKTSFLNVIISSILGWIVWTCLIYIIGGKLFSEANTKLNFKKLLIAVGYGHVPGIFRFFVIVPELLIPVIIITQIWMFLSISMGIKEVLNFESNLKSIGVVIIVFLIILFSFVFLLSQTFGPVISTG